MHDHEPDVVISRTQRRIEQALWWAVTIIATIILTLEFSRC